MKNGVEVKLQRNALSVLEPPTGDEEDDDYDFDDSSSGSDIGEKESHHFGQSPLSELCFINSSKEVSYLIKILVFGSHWCRVQKSEQA